MKRYWDRALGLLRVRRAALALVIATAALLAIGVGALVEAQRSNTGQFCAPAPSRLPPAKAARLQQYCARLAQRTPSPLPYGPQPPPDIARQTQNEEITLYGVNRLPPPPWAKDTYVFTNAWLSDLYVVYAGSLDSDKSQGVIVLAQRVRPFPQKLAEFLTAPKDGDLNVTAANGDILTLTARDGATYTFDVSKRTLSRQ
jgi:hypothetical protein